MDEGPPDLTKKAIERITAVLGGNAKFEDVEARLAWLPKLRLLTKFGGNPNQFLDSIKSIRRLRRALDAADNILTELDAETLHLMDLLLEQRGGLSGVKLEDVVSAAATALSSYFEEHEWNFPQHIGNRPEMYRVNAIIETCASHYEPLVGRPWRTGEGSHFEEFVRVVLKEMGERIVVEGDREKDAKDGLHDRIRRVLRGKGQ